MQEQLLETWDIHNRIHLYVLEAVSAEALAGRAGGKGRTVGEMFAHLHNVRLMWLQAAAPELLEGLTKLDKSEAADGAALSGALARSGAAVGTMLGNALRDGGRIKGFKPHAVAFLGYLVSHESHHRGEIGLALGQSGHPLPKKIDYGMWEWGVR